MYPTNPPPGWPPAPPTAQTAQAALQPPSTMERARQGLRWYRMPVYEPRPFFPEDPMVGIQPRRYTANITNSTINQEIVKLVQIDIPGTVYALTGAAFDTNALVSLDNNTWLVRFEHSSGDRLDTNSALASCLVGSAQFPALIGGVGWNFDRGSTVRVGVTPLKSNMRIDVALWVIETRGPVNYGALG